METCSTQAPRLEQQEKSLFLFMVVVGYIITFAVAAQGGERFSIARLLAGIGFGAVYLVIGFFEAELLQRFSPTTRNAVFFSVELAMVFGIGWMLGPGGSWLIGLPLAPIAVENLSRRARWPVYLGLLAAIIPPILRYSTLDVALMNMFVLSAAIFFVVLFTQFRLSEREARQSAEQLAIQLEAANHRLMEYAAKVEELAAAQERNRLAREIHDNLGHTLTIVNIQIEAARLILESEPQRALNALNTAQQLVKGGLTSMRESVFALRMSSLENRPLQDVLSSLADETRLSGIHVDWKMIGEPQAVDEKIALAFYRAAQEGLTNVRKHANASCVDVALDFSQPGRLRLTIRDDGVGTADASGGFGLIGIRERIRMLDGECKIDSQPGNGFLLEVCAPLSVGRRA